MEFRNSPKAANFFVEVIVITTIVFLIRVESHPTPLVSFSGLSHNSFVFPVQKNLPETAKKDTIQKPFYVPEWKKEAFRRVNELLSPSTLSRTDLFQYLVREIFQVLGRKYLDARTNFDYRMRNNQIPERTMPYARALRSIMDAVVEMQEVRNFMICIRNNRSPVPPEISSPPTLSSYGIFSPDIFADPDIPVQLMNKLIEIPKSEIPNVIIQLQDYMKICEGYGFYKNHEIRWHRQYAQFLMFFLEKNSILDNLKNGWTEIQRISDSNRNSTEDGKMNEETSSSTV